MAARLNTRQLEVLRWIGDGCPDGVMKGHTYKTTAVALQGRRLVTVSRKGGIWRAELTGAGRFYLLHGSHPDSSLPRSPNHAAPVTESSPRSRPVQDAAQRPAMPIVRPLQPGPGELAESLVARVLEGGGVLEVGADEDGTDYPRLIKVSGQVPNLPFGKQLRLRSKGSWRDRRREIYLDEEFSVRVAPRPVPVPQRVTAYHPAVVRHRDDVDRHEVSKDSLGRASRILQAVAIEAERRGHTVEAAAAGSQQYNTDFFRSLKDGQLRIAVEGFAYRLRIHEQGRAGGAPLPYTVHANRTLPRWRKARRTEFIPTGTLRITLENGYSRDERAAEFRDTKTTALEERLPAVLRELEIRALEDDHRRQEEQRQADLKRQRWERAIDQARHDFRETGRADLLTSQLQSWRLAKELDSYLSQMRTIIVAMTSEEERAAAQDWLNWISQHRQSIDPLRQPLPVPPDPRRRQKISDRSCAAGARTARTPDPPRKRPHGHRAASLARPDLAAAHLRNLVIVAVKPDLREIAPMIERAL
jgi:hypothetical protein